MAVQVINPYGMTARDWTDAMVINLEQFGNIGRLENEDQWRDWALQLMTLGSLSGTTVPDPYGFLEWRPWAEALTKNLAGVM
jgi:hypothetical protein